MKKKCVRWTKSVRAAFVAIAVILTALVVTPSAQSTDPSTLPRLAFEDLSYVGAFRLPSNSVNGDDYSFGGRQLAFNPANNSLFVGSRRGNIAEVTIPTPVRSTNPEALPFASYRQPFADPTEGHLSQIAGEGVAVDSLMVFGNRLYGTAFIYYDANNTQRVSHYSRSLTLNEPSFQGWSSVWHADKSGFVAGAMSAVPSEWQSLLGGPAISGQCCIPIVTRTSWGPAAFSFDPAQIGQASVPATPLLYYTGEHSTLGSWDASNPTYGATVTMGGMVIVPGTRTVLYFGSNGVGTNCYGNGTADQSLVGSIAADGEKYCYDPTSADKGSHAYPYRYQIWAYDLNDLADVKAGRKEPWAVVPYGVWPFDLPTAATTVKLGGLGYDAATHTLYFSQLYADKDGYSYRPVIHVLHVNGTSSTVNPDETPLSPAPATTTTTTAPTTTPTTTPVTTSTTTPATTTTTATSTTTTSTTPSTTPTASVVSAITLSVDKPSPQVAGTVINLSAYAIGGVTPQEYKWLINDGTGFKPATGWSTVETFAWTPAFANAKYRVRVWARSYGNTEDEPEAIATTTFAITGSVTAPPATSTVTAASTTTSAGTQMQITVNDRAAATTNWLGLFFVGAPDSAAIDWQYLNATKTMPTSAISSGTFVFTAPAQQGNLEVRLYGKGFARLATSAVISNTGSGTSASSTTSTTATVTATTSVRAGAAIQAAVANSAAAATDWVGVFAVGAADSQAISWCYLNGAQTQPASAITNGTYTFTAPAAGRYEVRLYGKGFVRRATSASITVSP